MKKFLISLSFASILASSLYAQVYAVVDGENITERDFLFLQQVMPNANIDSLPKEMKEQVINQAIERKLLTREAKKDKLENTPEFKEALEEFKETFILELWMRKQLDSIKVSESDIKKFYNDNKDKLVVPETADARHILVSTEKEAKDIINELNKVKADKVEEKFIELAKAKSIDPSKDNGGDLGVFAKDKMVPSFSKATFDLKEKSYTKTPVKTDFGYHVIYLKSKKPQGVLSYDEAKGRIEQELQLMKFRDVVAQKSQELKKKAKIEIK